MTNLLKTFCARAEDAVSTVHVMSDPRAAASLVDRLADGGELVLTPNVTHAWSGVIDALESPYVVAAHDLLPAWDFDVGVIHGEIAVAETGSVLTLESDLVHRLASMLTLQLVPLVHLSDLVGSLDDAADWLAARSGRPDYAVLMTGPSKTADIERSLTVGVQGPSRLDVVLVNS